MQLLGPNLEDLLQYCGGTFSLKTTLMLFDQLLQRFESLHNACHLYRDVKPENFLIGTGVDGNTVYMTDLGLAIHDRAKEWRGQPKKSTYVEPNLLGTCRYTSINAHLGIAQTPRDDLEALGYMMVYFLKGSLPWQGLKTSSRRTRYRRVLELKRDTPVEQLCQGLPAAFVDYFKYIQSLPPGSCDYDFIRKIFRRLFKQQGFENDYVFDWTVVEFYRRQHNA